MHKYRALDVVEDDTGLHWKILRTEGHIVLPSGESLAEYRALGPLQWDKPKPTTITETHIIKKIND